MFPESDIFCEFVISSTSKLFNIGNMNVRNFNCLTYKSNVFKDFIILCFTRLRLISCYMINEKFSDACHFSLHHTRSKITLNSNSMSYM